MIYINVVDHIIAIIDTYRKALRLDTLQKKKKDMCDSLPTTALLLIAWT